MQKSKEQVADSKVKKVVSCFAICYLLFDICFWGVNYEYY